MAGAGAGTSHTRLTTARTGRAPPPVQGYKMRDEEEGDGGNIINPDHDGGIRTAVDVWVEDPTAAKARYGPIASWESRRSPI